MTSTADPPRIYRIDALLAEGFTRSELYNFRRTGVLPTACGRGQYAYYTDVHLKVLRAIKAKRDERITLADIAERFGREFKGWNKHAVREQ